MSADRAVHAVPSGPDFASHRASSQCPCRPVVCADLEMPSRLVFLHQRQTEVKQVERTGK